jgi:hypothetical protein
MKTTLAVCTTHRGMSDETYESVVNAQPIAIMKHKGSACVDIARSVTFDRAHATLEAHPNIDMLLCVDDDIVFTPQHAETLIAEARKRQHPVSGRYATIERNVAAMRPPGGGMYYTGLGFLAIPRAPFMLVAEQLDSNEMGRIGKVRTWCRTGEVAAFPGAWSPEDLWFCNHFGGVYLSETVVVGHLKTFAIAPKSDAGLIQLPGRL